MWVSVAATPFPGPSRPDGAARTGVLPAERKNASWPKGTESERAARRGVDGPLLPPLVIVQLIHGRQDGGGVHVVHFQAEIIQFPEHPPEHDAFAG